MTGIKDPKSRLIFALDVPSLDEAVSFVQKLDGSVGMFKVGLELFIKEGPAVLAAIKDHSDAEIFLDLKLHDIPATVERAVQSAAAHKVRFLTVHCAGGETMLKAAINGAVNLSVLDGWVFEPGSQVALRRFQVAELGVGDPEVDSDPGNRL